MKEKLEIDVALERAQGIIARSPAGDTLWAWGERSTTHLRKNDGDHRILLCAGISMQALAQVVWGARSKDELTFAGTRLSEASKYLHGGCHKILQVSPTSLFCDSSFSQGALQAKITGGDNFCWKVQDKEHEKLFAEGITDGILDFWTGVALVGQSGVRGGIGDKLLTLLSEAGSIAGFASFELLRKHHPGTELDFLLL